MNVDIIQACTIGDTQSVIEGLELQMDNDTVALAVQAAAKNGHTACVAALLPFYPAQIDDGASVRNAAMHGHVECVKLLFPVSVFEHDIIRCNVLSEAVNYGHLDCLKFLAPHYDLTKLNGYLVMNAAQHGHTECLDFLLKIPCTTEQYTKALERAAYNGHIQCVRKVLPLCDEATVALYWAAQKGFALCVDELYAHSDIEHALDVLQKNHPHLKHNWSPLAQRWENEQQRRAILQTLDDTNPSVFKRKM